MKKLVLLIGLLPMVAVARPVHDDRQGDEKPLMSWHGEEHLPPYLENLELSNKQKADIKTLLKIKLGDSRARFDAEHELRMQLRALSFSADYSDGKAQALLEKTAAIHQQLALEKSKLDHEIFLLLTAEQQEKLKTEIGKFEH